jgi:hypothetical protein
MSNPHIRDHARIEGFTVEIALSSAECDLVVYVKPGTDLDGRFRAICAETGDTLTVNGWLFTVDAFDFLAAA